MLLGKVFNARIVYKPYSIVYDSSKHGLGTVDKP